MVRNPKYIALKVTDNKTAKENPIKPKKFPKNIIMIIRDTILKIATFPTWVDSLACNFAVNIEDIDKGIKVMVKSCKLCIPSEYSGKTCCIIKGAKIIIKITTTVEATNTKIIGFLCI